MKKRGDKKKKMMMKSDKKKMNQVTDFSGNSGDRFFRKGNANVRVAKVKKGAFGRKGGGLCGNRGVNELGKLHSKGDRFNAHKFLFVMVFVSLFLVAGVIATSLTLTFGGSNDLIDGLMNRTELSNSSFGVRLDAPVLFMDFNNPAENPLSGYSGIVGAGTYVQDNSLFNNFGTTSGMNGSYWVDGISGNGLEFDGVNDLVNVPSITNNLSMPRTYSLWFKIPLNQDNQKTLLNVGNLKPLIALKTNKINWYDGSVDRFSGTVFFNDQQWHHLAIINTGTNITFYFDGTFAGNKSVGTGSSTGLSIGNVAASYTYFNGTIDNVQIYNCSLNSTQIEALNNTPGSEQLCPDDSDGLVSHWALNETSGTVAVDSKGTNNGTLTGYPSDSVGTTPNWNSSCGTTGSGFDLGGCYEFDGVDDYVEVDGLTFDSNEITLSLWAYSDNFDQGYSFLMDKNPTGNRFGLLLTPGNVVELRGATNSGPNTAIPNSGWVHIVGTIDGTTATIYINGTKATQGTTTALVQDSTALSIGSFHGNNYFFNGSIDQVQIFNRALSASEILNLYNGTLHCYDDETLLLSESGWKLFAELEDGEKVATLSQRDDLAGPNQEMGEIEWQLPLERQVYDYSGEMYEITGKHGKFNLVVSPEHKIYVKVGDEGWSLGEILGISLLLIGIVGLVMINLNRNGKKNG